MRYSRVVFWVLFLFCALYLVQILSPLRINHDSYRQLSMAVFAYKGAGYLVNGQIDQYPLGYPALVHTLLSLGIANPSVLIFVNLVFLSVALLSVAIILRRLQLADSTTTLILIILGSWVTIKHITLPISDVPYFGISSLCLLATIFALERPQRAGYVWLGLSLILGYVALLFRTVAVTLLPVIILCILLRIKWAKIRARWPFGPKKTTLIIGCTSIALVLGVLILLQTSWFNTQFLEPQSYFQSLIRKFSSNSALGIFVQNFKMRALEFSELFINLPSNKFPWLLPIFYAVGFTAWSILIYGIWLLLKVQRSLLIGVYILSYVMLMLIWPYYDSRFWIPVWPWLIVACYVALSNLTGRLLFVRKLLPVYLSYFLLAGALALVFSTKLSLSGRDFGEVFSGGDKRMSYRYAFQNSRPIKVNEVDYTIVHLLKTFDPLAQSANTVDDAEEK